MSKGSDFCCVANLEHVVYDQEWPRGRLPLTDASVNEERELFENEPKQSLREAKRALPDLSLSSVYKVVRKKLPLAESPPTVSSRFLYH